MTADEKLAHELVDRLRSEGWSVGLDGPVNADLDEHVDRGKDLLESDDLGAYFVVAIGPVTTDFSGSTILEGTAAGVLQIQMLGAHFRAVHDSTGLDVGELVDAVVDEAVAIDDADERAEP